MQPTRWKASIVKCASASTPRSSAPSAVRTPPSSNNSSKIEKVWKDGITNLPKKG